MITIAEKVDILKRQLNSLISNGNLDNPLVLEISQELDKTIVEFYTLQSSTEDTLYCRKQVV
ncbi:Spo0E like sporulation regulatory protein [Oxobacter pfennigii]|uniref:Spo0E like sporulation regulatory protein n=2 Tax=Oxobacter pfennigii TaxID=36849 RepID=A0A0P8WKD8_9CLOT|nr:Spo0E like sporulation regulatory protein [Oxobacter pfennigii]